MDTFNYIKISNILKDTMKERKNTALHTRWYLKTVLKWQNTWFLQYRNMIKVKLEGTHYRHTQNIFQYLILEWFLEHFDISVPATHTQVYKIKIFKKGVIVFYCITFHFSHADFYNFK